MKNVFTYSKQLLTRLGRDDMTSYAAALAYKFLFALFPLALFLTALLAFMHLPRTVQSIVGPLSNLMPQAVVNLLQNNIAEAVTHENPTILSLGILGFIWGMTGAFMELMDAFNHAYELPYPFRRTALQRYALGIGTGIIFGILFVVMLLVAAGGTLFTHWLLGHILHLPIDQAASFVLHWVLLLALMVISLDVLYSILPDTKLSFRLLSPGTVLATIVFLVLSLGFSLYTSHFHSYNKMYGSLGAVILLLLYLYLFSLAILLGVEVNALSHHNAQDPPHSRKVLRENESGRPK
ncbi:MAG: YihY/virulence factor BrkB family protein [Firmicutes bacterium]|jgi:membrane protein|uniref:YihY/virulence factor BrkB family protein n=1 Tax=Sulfobacillus benefaciens TaxID=453960 RepID=A0A2T2X3Q3_9FIRM|nr:YihY/virulence factor BrkB family protein [Bacillota bacterium]MCL5015925.1 YihY/virulence factor BrkB family protein [Bacillota bacterium]PSR29086.1 MAG: hypothetical protein C7B43_08735 [Sulfobacillus benefaciens]